MAIRATKPSAGSQRKTATAKQPPRVAVADVEAVVKQILSTMEGDFTVNDIKLYRELESLARYIESAKAEIAALSPDEISSTHIPTATDELDAIVDATEDATNAIMGAAEKIEAVGATLEGQSADSLTEAVTAIYEACGFQDITGQRITKVVKALKHIDEKIADLVAAFGEEIKKYKANKPAEEAAPVEVNTEENLLNGPQFAADAKSQAEIDALLSSLD